MPTKFRVMVLLTVSSLTAIGCRERNTPSFVKYAHVGSSQLLSTPIGRLGLQDSGIKHTLGDGLSICVRRYGINQFTDQSLLLETKLAHVMWLTAAGYGAAEFSRFRFTLSESCTGDFSNVVALEHPSLPAQSSDEKSGAFNEAKLSCGPRGENAYGCSSDGGITLGWGSPGSISYSYMEDAPQKWTHVRSSSPSMVRLSPFVDWLSLGDDIISNAKLSKESKAKLVAGYKALLESDGPTQNFDDLVRFGNLLGELGVTMGEDQEFAAVLQNSASQEDAFTGRSYRPKQAAFHTLLHEVGHTFGLTHADNPGQGDITGPSATAVFNPARNQFITKMASMAYGEPYGFLTEDDRMGAASAAAAVNAEIANHR